MISHFLTSSDGNYLSRTGQPWLGAATVRDGDLADRQAQMFGVQQRLGLPPDPVAMPVELHRGDPIDGLAAAFFRAICDGQTNLTDAIQSDALYLDGDPHAIQRLTDLILAPSTPPPDT